MPTRKRPAQAKANTKALKAYLARLKQERAKLDREIVRRIASISALAARKPAGTASSACVRDCQAKLARCRKACSETERQTGRPNPDEALRCFTKCLDEYMQCVTKCTAKEPIFPR